MSKKSKHNDLEEAVDKILSAALNCLAKRDYSVYELRSKLLARGADTDKVDEVLAQLVSRGYLDDVRYCLTYVRHRREFRPCGAVVIRRELRAHKIDEESIEIALDKEYNEQQQIDALKELLAKAIDKYPPDLDYEGQQKMRAKTVRKLLAKGFSLPIILDEMDSIGESED